MRRYNARHNAVLEVIEKGIRPHLSEGDSLLSLVDLPTIHPYTFLPILICHLILFFGTIETELYALWNSPSAMSQLRYEEAQIHKVNKYADLIEEIKERDFITDLITLEGPLSTQQALMTSWHISTSHRWHERFC